MTRPHHAPIPANDGGCRNRRRPRGERRPAWVRPYRRLEQALDASARLIDSTLNAVAESERSAVHRPIGTVGKLDDASGRLLAANRRLTRAARELARTSACIGREPETAHEVPKLLLLATVRWVQMSGQIVTIANDVFALQSDVLDGLESGELVLERLRGRGPRIILAPRPVPIRAFLSARKRRAVDRISPVLRRRRRTPRPAAVSVPRRTSQGRAPPLVPVCLF